MRPLYWQKHFVSTNKLSRFLRNTPTTPLPHVSPADAPMQPSARECRHGQWLQQRPYSRGSSDSSLHHTTFNTSYLMIILSSGEKFEVNLLLLSPPLCNPSLPPVCICFLQFRGSQYHHQQTIDRVPISPVCNQSGDLVHVGASAVVSCHQVRQRHIAMVLLRSGSGNTGGFILVDHYDNGDKDDTPAVVVSNRLRM